MRNAIYTGPFAVYYDIRATLSSSITRPNLKIDNKLKPKRNKAFRVSAIFGGDILQFFILNFEF